MEAAGANGMAVRQSAWRGWLEALVNLAGGAWLRPKATADRRMQVLETMPLGPKKQLLLVSCDGEQFLIGTSADSVQTIVLVRSRTRDSVDWA